MKNKPYYAHETAIVERGARVGAGSQIWHHTHVRRGAAIGMLCRLGKNVYVDEGAVVGSRCKIQNNCSIYKGVTLGADVFVGPHVTFTNDKFPRASGSWILVPTDVAHHASIGAHATILCGIAIGEYAMIAAGAVVTKSVNPHALIVGNPGQQVGWVCRLGHSMTIGAFGVFNCHTCGAKAKITVTFEERKAK